jgi:hypothetical protein
VWGSLARNREQNQCEFAQINGVIADAPLCMATVLPRMSVMPHGAENYTCLVADCEGCTPEQQPHIGFQPEVRSSKMLKRVTFSDSMG